MQNPARPNRKTVRLRIWDYSARAHYFVTICSREQACIFGSVQLEKVILTPIGELVQCQLLNLPQQFSDVRIDFSVIMPNHLHAIIELLSDTPQNSKLATVIGTFKSKSTAEAIKLGLTQKSLWQTRYHEHIIRSDQSLYKIRRYIELNPVKWHLDELNLEAVHGGVS